MGKPSASGNNYSKKDRQAGKITILRNEKGVDDVHADTFLKFTKTTRKTELEKGEPSEAATEDKYIARTRYTNNKDPLGGNENGAGS